MNIQFGGRDIDGELVYENDFSSLEDLWCEGSPDMSVKDNKLVIKSTYERTDDFHWVMSAFVNKVFTGDLLVEYDAQSIDEKSHRNFNFFIHTTLTDGRDLYETRDERTGNYAEYHEMNNYLFTFLASGNEDMDIEDPVRYRMRRDPGFRLIKEAHSYTCDNFRWYNMKYLVKGGRISMCVDNLPSETYTWIDPDPLTEGYIGFRTYMSRLEYRNLKVYSV